MTVLIEERERKTTEEVELAKEHKVGTGVICRFELLELFNYCKSNDRICMRLISLHLVL